MYLTREEATAETVVEMIGKMSGNNFSVAYDCQMCFANFEISFIDSWCQDMKHIICFIDEWIHQCNDIFLFAQP